MLVALLSTFALLLSSGILAQRPDTASLCDYYAIQLTGSNTSASQFTLIQNIVALAFAGGSGQPNISSSLTGIFNPGTVRNINTGVTIPIDLGSWFNGTRAISNVNGGPAIVDWLDDGAKTPLLNYLNGVTPNITLHNTTNEFRLFTHWLGAFSHIFGCTLPTALPPATGGALNLAYVHKYMDLNQTDIAHFIDQLMLSATYWGWSAEDTNQESLKMNTVYNVRCSPPVGTQLYSLCQDPTCPLADSPDCAVYADLQASGIVTGSASATGSASTSTSTSSSSSSSSSTTTSSTTSSASPSATSSPPAPVLSSGGIAGVAVGGAAVVFAFIAVLIWLFKRKQVVHIDSFQPSPMNPSYVQPASTDPHSSYTARSRNAVESWNGPPIAEMESPRFEGSNPEMGNFPSPGAA